MRLTRQTRNRLAEVARRMNENETMMGASDPMFYYESMLKYVGDIQHQLSVCMKDMDPTLKDIEDLQHYSPHGADDDWTAIEVDMYALADRLEDYKESIQTLYDSAVGAIIEAKKKKPVGTKSRKYKGKEYTASAGSLVSLAKSGGSKKKAVGAGAFDWATEPYAAATAAEIVDTGTATSQRRKKGK